MDAKDAMPRHCATYWQKAHAASACLHHEEIFQDWVRLFHGFIGASALLLCLPSGYRIVQMTNSSNRSSPPLLLHFFAALLIVSHSWLKAFTGSCISGTEVGAECGQLFNSLIFDVLVVGNVATMLCHPCKPTCGF